MGRGLQRPEAQPRAKRAPSAAGVTGNSGCRSLTAAATAASRAASSRPGSWWNGTRCFTPASRAKASASWIELCPQPTWRGTLRACTARRGGADRRRVPGRSPRSIPARGGIAEPRARARGPADTPARRCRFDPVADCGPGVAHAPSRNQEGPDGDRSADHVVQLEPARHVTQHQGEQWRREVAPESGLQAERGAGRPPDVHLHSRAIQRTEETQAEDVVHVEVREQHVHPCQSPRQLRREGPNAGPRIEHDDPSLRSRQSHARRVAAVSGRRGTRRRERAADPVQRDVHGPGRSQNIATAPSSFPS